mmetsp:Transcript_39910/g.104632  ORF Transcript_39910/g.104632 Transcript_39910/m.104632 type:complete len:209 (+) Transcript_39910:2519-3145(+)
MPLSDCIGSPRRLQMLQVLGRRLPPARPGLSPPLPRRQYCDRPSLLEDSSMFQSSQRTVPAPADLTFRPIPPPQHHSPGSVPAGSLEPLLQHLLEMVQVFAVLPLALQHHQRLVPVVQVPRRLPDGHPQRQCPCFESLLGPTLPSFQATPGKALGLPLNTLRQQGAQISRPNVLLVPQAQATLETMADNTLELGQAGCTSSCAGLRKS